MAGHSFERTVGRNSWIGSDRSNTNSWTPIWSGTWKHNRSQSNAVKSTTDSNRRWLNQNNLAVTRFHYRQLTLTSMASSRSYRASHFSRNQKNIDRDNRTQKKNIFAFPYDSDTTHCQWRSLKTQFIFVQSKRQNIDLHTKRNERKKQKQKNWMSCVADLVIVVKMNFAITFTFLLGLHSHTHTHTHDRSSSECRLFIFRQHHCPRADYAPKTQKQ